MTQALSGWLIGLLIGMRHALEPDHLAAVSTLVAERRTKPVGMLLGAAWGLGHTITLALAAGVLVVLRAQMPAGIESGLEILVALMLIGLGARALVQAYREGRHGPPTWHSHGESGHMHNGAVDHIHLRTWTVARRPLLVGLVHGLAGSGALTAAVLASMPTVHSALVYVVLFGAGSAVGMTLLTGLTGRALSTMARQPRTTSILLACSGALSVGLGVLWGCKHALALLG